VTERQRIPSRAIEFMRLQEIRAELCAVSGRPYRFEGDRERRQQLWKRLDTLISFTTREGKQNGF
jgi:hypothetical protein